MTEQSLRPLSGVRAIGIEQYIAGPYCSLLLADAGAEVIKIERPGVGDPRREIPPFAQKGDAKKAGGYMAYNRNKKSLALNLRSEAGRAVLHRLAEVSDVIVENLRPGAMEKLGIGYESLKDINPRIIYAMISGFGRLPGYESEYAQRPAFDIVAEAMSGVMDLVGFEDRPPTSTLYGLADVHAGMVGAFGIMQALFMRERTGKGQLVDVSLVDSMLALNERMVALLSVSGKAPERGKPDHFWPRGAFECSDGFVALNVPTFGTVSIRRPTTSFWTNSRTPRGPNGRRWTLLPPNSYPGIERGVRLWWWQIRNSPSTDGGAPNPLWPAPSEPASPWIAGLWIAPIGLREPSSRW